MHEIRPRGDWPLAAWRKGRMSALDPKQSFGDGYHHGGGHISSEGVSQILCGYNQGALVEAEAEVPDFSRAEPCCRWRCRAGNRAAFSFTASRPIALYS